MTAPRWRSAAALVLIAGVIVAVAGATTATASGPSCRLASAKRVKAALGITVSAPTVTRNGPVTVCEFAAPAPLLVRFETHESTALFAAGRKGFTKHGEPTKTVSGLGSAAYSSSLDGGKSNTIVVLKDATELLITGARPLAKLEALARLIVPAL
jgi:hypothetical protein